MKKGTQEYYQEVINRAIEYMEANVSNNISLAEIADYAYLSKFHFHRIFKSVIGNTTKDYLTRLRLEKSAMLLKNTQNPISQIAYNCGYRTPETYTRAFNSFFSMTPTHFRKTSKAEIVKKGILYSTTTFKELNLDSPKIIENASLDLAYIRHFGSYKKIDQAFEQLTVWAMKYFIVASTPRNIGIVYDNPLLTEESNLRFDACIVVPREIVPQGEIGYKRIKGGKFAVFRYQGPFEDFFTVYDYIYNVCIFKYNWKLRDEPALEFYISAPPFCDSKQLVTDFYLPIL